MSRVKQISSSKRSDPDLDPDPVQVQLFLIRIRPAKKVPDPDPHWKKREFNIPNLRRVNISLPVKISLKICFASRNLEPGDPGGQCGRPAEALAAGPVRDGGEPSPAPGGMVPRQAGSSLR